MGVSLKVTTKGLRGIHGRFVKVTDDMELTFRQRLQMLMRALREATRDEGPPSLGKYVGYRTQVVSKTPVHMRGTVVLKKLPSKYPPKLWDYILRGTRRHPIVAKRAKALRFYWAKMGGVVFFKSVHHRGTKPNDFPARAFRRVGPGLLRRTAEAIGLTITSRLGGR